MLKAISQGASVCVRGWSGGSEEISVPDSFSFWILWIDLSLTKVASNVWIHCLTAGIFLPQSRKHIRI